MAKSKKTPEEKVLIKVEKDIRVCGDSNGFWVEYLWRKDGKKGQAVVPTRHYYPSLPLCYEDIFQQKLRRALGDSKKKDIKNMVKVIRKIKEELYEKLQPISEFTENDVDKIT